VTGKQTLGLAPVPGNAASTSQVGDYKEVVQAFGKVSAALGDFRDLDGLLHLIAEQICELVGVSRCSLYLRDKSSGLFRGQVGHWHHNIDERIKRLVSGVDADGFTAQILATKSPVVVEDTRADPRPIRSTMREWQVRSMLGVPMVLREEIIGIIYLDDEEKPRSYSQDDSAIASAFADLAAVAISQAQLTADLRSRLLTVARQNRAMRQASDAEDRLTSLALNGGSVQDVAEAVADLTQKAVSIHDASQRRIAGATRPDAEDGEGELPRLLDSGNRELPAVQSALAALGDGTPEIVEPIPRAGINRRSLLAPVMIRGELWGSLVVAEHSRLSSADIQIARRAATIVAWEMSAERRALAATDDARASLLSELIRGARDIDAVIRRSDYLGVELRRQHLLCLIAGGEEESAAGLLAGLGEIDALAADSEDGIVLLLPVEELVTEEQPDAGKAAAALLSDLGEGSRAAISAPCSEIEAYPAALSDARLILRCIDSFCGPEVRVLSVADMGPGRMLFATSDPQEIDRFAAETLGRLLEPSAAREELLRTLAAFFAAGRSVRKAATELDVHENTIRYRLTRIEALSGLDILNDSDAQFNAQLAMIAIALRGSAGPCADLDLS
jgi:sugar diacid utilization regulator